MLSTFCSVLDLSVVEFHYLLEECNDRGMVVVKKRVARFPEALLCNMSRRFKDLCANTSKRSFSCKDVFGMSQGTWNEQHFNKCLHDRLLDFGEWLSGMKFNNTRLCGYADEIWYFGAELGAPRFQNDLLRHLRSQYCIDNPEMTFDKPFIVEKCFFFMNYDPDSMIDWCEYRLDHESLEETCSLQACFSHPKAKWLKLMLDLLTCAGFDDITVQTLLKGKDNLGEHFAMLLCYKALPANNHNRLPWHPDEFDQYLLEEDLSKEEPNKKPNKQPKTVEDYDDSSMEQD